MSTLLPLPRWMDPYAAMIAGGLAARAALRLTEPPAAGPAE